MGIRHPFEPETIYDLNEDGNVTITRDGSVGVFTPEGIYISGDIREADPQMCVWTANNPDPNSQLTPSRFAERDS
ncbi:MAG: hypothetical protein O3B72_10980 [Proteobacteria bacterium]|nr:hypothetical protein [Pseudomonadota bacterium]